MPKLIHVATFGRIKPLKKIATVHDTCVRLERRQFGTTHTWETTLEVVIAESGLEVGELLISYKDEAALTVWAAVWKINKYGVAKIDVEREDKAVFPDQIETKGKLNSRRQVIIPAFVPHWSELDPGTGELSGHYTDAARFPAKMPIDDAVPKWCLDELNITIQPAGLKYFREMPKGLERVGMKGLFEGP